MHYSTETAVILFAESVKLQTQKKSFYKDIDHNHELLNRFVQRSLKVAKGSGLDVFHIDERLQKGVTFADRITNSIQEVFDRGYAKIIVMGSDCPDLKTNDLILINSKLQTQELVLGPDFKGGVYAIGLTKQSFDYQRFRGLCWQSGELRKSFAQYAKHLTKSIFWLKTKSDFNDKDDILKYWHLSGHLRSIIERLIKSIQNLVILSQSVPIRLLVPTIDKRGP